MTPTGTPTASIGARPTAAGARLALLALLALGACDEPSWWHTEQAIIPICERVLECGGWGYVDTGECQDGLVGTPALGTSCEDEPAYLDCVHQCCWDGCRASESRESCRACQPPDCNQCDHLSCEAFAGCEALCRERHCGSP